MELAKRIMDMPIAQLKEGNICAKLVQEIQQYTTRKPEAAVGELYYLFILLLLLSFLLRSAYLLPYNYNILFIFGDLVGNNLITCF